MPVTERDMSPPSPQNEPTFHYEGKAYHVAPIWQLYTSNFLSDLNRHIRRRVITQLLPRHGLTDDFEAAQLGFDITCVANALQPVLNVLDKLTLHVQTAFQPTDKSQELTERHQTLATLLLPSDPSHTAHPTAQMQYDHATKACLTVLESCTARITPDIHLSTNYTGLEIDLEELPPIAYNQSRGVSVPEAIESFKSIIRNTHTAICGEADLHRLPSERQRSEAALQTGLAAVRAHIFPNKQKSEPSHEEALVQAYESNLNLLFSQFRQGLTAQNGQSAPFPSAGLFMASQNMAELPITFPQMMNAPLVETSECLLLGEMNIFMISLEHLIGREALKPIVTQSYQARLGRPQEIGLSRLETAHFISATRTVHNRVSTARKAVETMIHSQAGYTPQAPSKLKVLKAIDFYTAPGLRQ